MRVLLAWLLLATALTAQGGVIGGGVGGAPETPQQPRDPRARMVGGKGVIRGRVTAADSGAPMRRAAVMIMGEGQRGTYTDSDGRFQFTGLPAGQYTLVAAPSPHHASYQIVGFGPHGPGPGRRVELAEAQVLEHIDFALPRGGVISGRVVDPYGEPAARVNVAALVLRPGGEPTPSGPTVTTDDLGQYRLFGLAPGTYLVRADLRSGMFWSGPQENEGEPVGFATTYAPGTYTRADATRLRVSAGMELNADVRLLETRIFAVSGMVVTASGEPAKGVEVSLVHNEPGSSSSFGASPGPEGSFTFRNVPPGTYEIHARTHAARPQVIDGPRSVQEAGVVRVDVTTADVENVVVAIRPGETVRGEIVFDGVAPPTFRASVSVQTAERRYYFVMAPVTVDGSTFSARDLFGAVLLRGSLSAPGTSWPLKAVLLDGRDVTDVPTAFTSAHSGRLQIVFTTSAPALEGIVTDDGKPAMRDTQVAVFGADESTWIPHSSRLRTSGVGPDGKYVMRGLREGRYYVVATPSGTVTFQPPDRAFLEALKKVATEVVLNAGETRTVDLRVVRIEQ